MTLTPRFLIFLGISTAMTLSGCASSQRRYEMLPNVAALPNLEQRQVLKNLARTADDPYALPFYAQVTQANFNLHKRDWARQGLAFVPYLFFDFLFDLALDRVIAGSMTTTPTNDPDRLELMQTAYQLAVRPEAVDPAAYSRLWQFLGDDPRVAIGRGWVGVGRNRHAVPADVYLYDRSHHTFAWVSRGQVRELTRFTLMIQRIATAPDKVIPSPLPKPADDAK